MKVLSVVGNRPQFACERKKSTKLQGFCEWAVKDSNLRPWD